MLRSLTTCIIFFYCLSSAFSQIPELEIEEDDYMDMLEVLPDEPSDGSQKYYAIQYHGNKRQLVYGDSAISPIFDNIISTRHGNYIVLDKGKYGMLSEKGQEILPLKFDSIYSIAHSDDLVLKLGNKYGAISPNSEQNAGSSKEASTDKQIILEPQYNKILYADVQNGLILEDASDFRVMAINLSQSFEPMVLESVRLGRGFVVAKSDGKEGLIYQGKNTIPFKYDTLFFRHPKQQYYYGRNKAKTQAVKRQINYLGATAQMAIVKQGDFYGLIGLDGEETFPAEFDRIQFDHLRRLYKLSKDKKWGVYTSSNGLIVPVKYEQVYTDGTRFITLTLDGKKGIVDYSGREVLPVEFDKISIQGWSTAFQVVKDGKYGWYTQTGRELIPVIYDKLEDFGSFQPKYKGLFKASIDGKSGIIDTNGIVVPIEYDRLWSIYDGRYFVVTQDEKLGLYDTKGTLVLPAKYDWISQSKAVDVETLLLVKDGLHGYYINQDTIIEPQFKIIEHIHNRDLLKMRNRGANSYMRAQNTKGKWGVINEFNGKIIVPFKYDEIPQMVDARSGNFFIVRKKSKYGLVSDKGKTSVPLIYSSLNGHYTMWDVFGNDSTFYLVARKKGRVGAINYFNETQIPFEYEDMTIVKSHLYEGTLLLKAKRNGKYALIDAKGKPLTEFVFDHIANFEDGLAMSFRDGKMRMLNVDGAFQTEAITMEPHQGYTTYEALKLALWEAITDSSGHKLMDFCMKVAPSDHINYYVKHNVFNKGYPFPTNQKNIAERYYYEILRYRATWFNAEEQAKIKSILLDEEDYARYDRGILSVYRSGHQAMGARVFEKLLRSPMKVNGYWISTYYMKPQFSR